MELIIAVIIGLICANICQYITGKDGKSRPLAFFWGLFGGVFALLYYMSTSKDKDWDANKKNKEPLPWEK
jgi:hypothetical protein